MRQTITEAASTSDIVIPSFDDEVTTFGDSDAAATARRYASAGVRAVVVKNGAGPVHFTHDGEERQAEPPLVDKIVDTTAAGDSFNAGCFAGLDSRTAMGAQIRHASEIAGKVIGQKGALVLVDRAPG